MDVRRLNNMFEGPQENKDRIGGENDYLLAKLRILPPRV